MEKKLAQKSAIISDQLCSGRQAETFLGLRPEAWSLNSGVPEESVEKLQGLDKCIAELGVEKISQSNILLVQDTVIKDNVQTY